MNLEQGGGIMKKTILCIVCFLFSIYHLGTALATDTFFFDSAGSLSGYRVEITGPFSKPAEIQAGNMIIGYIARHKKFPSIARASQYVFLGRTGEKTFQLEAWNSTLDTKDVLNCYLDQNTPLNLDKFPFVYLPNSKKNRFKLRLIGLRGNSLVCQIIVPDEWKIYFKK